MNVKSFGLSNSAFEKISDESHNQHILSGITLENQGKIANCSNFKTLVGTDGKDGDAVSGFKENGLDGKDGISGWNANLLGGIVGTSSGNVMGCFNQGVMVGANGGNGSDGTNGVDGGNADAKEKIYATDAGNGGIGGHGGNASIIGGVVAKSYKSMISGKNNATLYAGKGGSGGAGGAGGKGGDSSSDSIDVLDAVTTQLGKPIWELLLDSEISFQSSVLPATAGGGGGAGGNGGATLVGSVAGTIFGDDLHDYDNGQIKIVTFANYQGKGGVGGKGGNGGKSVAYMATPETGWWISVIGAGAAGGGAGGNGYNGNDSSVVQICAQSINKYDSYSKLIEEYPEFFASSGTKGSQYSQSAGDTILYTNICEGGAGGTGNVNGFKGTSNAGTSFVPGKIPHEHGAGFVQATSVTFPVAVVACVVAPTPALKATALGALDTTVGILLSATGDVYYVLFKANKNMCSESTGGNDIQVSSKQPITPASYGGGIPALKWQDDKNGGKYLEIDDLSVLDSVYYTLQNNSNKDKYKLILKDNITVENASTQYKLCVNLDGNGKTITVKNNENHPRVSALFDIMDTGKITNTNFNLNIHTSVDSGKYSAWQFIADDKTKVANGNKDDCKITGSTIAVNATQLEYTLANNFTSEQESTLKNETVGEWWKFNDLEFKEGDGTEAKPYVIGDSDQWNAFVKYSNLGLSGYYFELNFNPTIGFKSEDASNTNFVIDTFKNHLDGNNFTLNLGQNENNVVFDGLVNINEGTIQNISIIGLTKQSAVAYTNIGTIENVSVSTTVQNKSESQKDISGFVYENQGTISNSIFKGKIENQNGGAYGFAVTNSGIISGCSTDKYTSITSYGADAAGCVKDNKQGAVIKNFVNNATITANQFNNDIIIQSAADVAKGNGHNAAGVAINNYGTISESINNGAITASSANDCEFDSEIKYTYKDNNGNTITEESTISGCSGGNAAGIAIYNIDPSSISYETDTEGNRTANYGTPTIVGTISGCQNFGTITAGNGGNNKDENGIGGDGGSVGDICIPYVTADKDGNIKYNVGIISGSDFGNGYYKTKTETIVQEDGTEIQQTVVDKIFLKQGEAGTGKQNGNNGKIWQAVRTGEIEEKTIVKVGDVVTQ